MQRPTRIIVFGVLCLVYGLVSGCKNTMEAAVAYAGPEVLEQFKDMAEQQRPLPETSELSLKVEIAAQAKPVYRLGQAIESTCSALMAMVLIFAGLSLFDGRPWALKLTKYWAWYAIPAAAVSTVLAVRYALPEMPDATTGMGMLNGAFMLIVLWTFPVVLLRLLPTNDVKAYLDWRSKHRAGTATIAPPQAKAQAHASNVAEQPAEPKPAPPPSRATPLPPQPSVSDTTWRDDPWNDPNSR